MTTFFLAVLLVAAVQAQQTTPQSAGTQPFVEGSNSPITFSISGNIGTYLAFDNTTQTNINLGGQAFTVVFSFDQQHGEASSRGCDDNSRYVESNKSPFHMPVTATCSSAFMATENEGNHSTATVTLGNLTFSSRGVNVKRLYVARSTPVTSKQTPAALEFTFADNTLGLVIIKLLLPAEALTDSDWRSPFSSTVPTSLSGTDAGSTSEGSAEICIGPGVRSAVCGKYIRAQLRPTRISSPASSPDASQAPETPPPPAQPQASSTCETVQPDTSASAGRTTMGGIIGGILGRYGSKIPVPLGSIGQVGQVIKKRCRTGEAPVIVRPNTQPSQ